jgi:hypothetical protein
LLIWLQVLLAVGALAGGASFILAPDGHVIQMPLRNLKDTPFKDFLIPGILLFTLVGLFPLAVAFRGRGPTGSGRMQSIRSETATGVGPVRCAGTIIIIWITVGSADERWRSCTFCIGSGCGASDSDAAPGVRRYYEAGAVRARPAA